jgi:hypothetical protein
MNLVLFKNARQWIFYGLLHCCHGAVSPCFWVLLSASTQRGGYNRALITDHYFFTDSGGDAVLGAPWVSDCPGALEWAAELKMA